MNNLIEDPRQAALLGFGLRLMSTPGKFGPAIGTAGLGAMQDARQAKIMQVAAQQRALEQQMMQEQLAEVRRQQERKRSIDGAYRGAYRSPLDQALAGGGGPTVANAQKAQTLQPTIDQQALIAELMKVDPISAYKMAQPSPDETVTVAPGGTVYSKRDNKALFTAPAAAEKPPGSVQEYQFAKSQGYTGTYEQWRQAGKPAGTTVNVNTGDKKLPPTVVKYQDEIIEKLTTARSIEADLGALEQQVNSGALKFGPVENVISQARNAVGASNENSRNFATFKSSLEKLRNDSLRLNTGVQTEGDAQRAWNELFQNINDQELVKQRLKEIRAINKRAAELQQYRLGVLRENFGASELPPPDIAPALPSGSVPSIKSDAEYQALPSGATFRAPDGSMRRKP